jgi:hypothetical protein
MLAARLSDAERTKDELQQRMDSMKRAAARAEREGELHTNTLQVRACMCCGGACVNPR